MQNQTNVLKDVIKIAKMINVKIASAKNAKITIFFLKTNVFKNVRKIISVIGL